MSDLEDTSVAGAARVLALMLERHAPLRALVEVRAGVEFGQGARLVADETGVDVLLGDGGRIGVEVGALEESGPAVTGGDYDAADPARPATEGIWNRGEDGSPVVVVAPAAAEPGWIAWPEVAAALDDVAAAAPGPEIEADRQWLADAGLANWRPLGRLPAGMVSVRASLHRVAEVVSAARHAVTPRIGLRVWPDGIGSPAFGDPPQRPLIRLRNGPPTLVAPDGELPLAGQSPRECAAVLNATVPELDISAFDETPLEGLDADCSALADAFLLAAGALEELRAEAAEPERPSRLQLWPEHFDVAFETGAEAEGRRAGYGFSPGDEAHDQPYFYVTIWEGDGEPARAALGRPLAAGRWQAEAYTGAELSHAEALAAGATGAQQRAALLAFWRSARDALRA